MQPHLEHVIPINMQKGNSKQTCIAVSLLR